MRKNIEPLWSVRWAQSAHVSNSSQATPKLTENIKAYPIINNSCIPDEGQYQKEQMNYK